MFDMYSRSYYQVTDKNVKKTIKAEETSNARNTFCRHFYFDVRYLLFKRYITFHLEPVFFTAISCFIMMSN